MKIAFVFQLSLIFLFFASVPRARTIIISTTSASVVHLCTETICSITSTFFSIFQQRNDKKKERMVCVQSVRACRIISSCSQRIIRLAPLVCCNFFFLHHSDICAMLVTPFFPLNFSAGSIQATSTLNETCILITFYWISKHLFLISF